MSLAEESGLNLTLSETPKTGFLASRSVIYLNLIQTNLNFLAGQAGLFKTCSETCETRPIFIGSHMKLTGVYTYVQIGLSTFSNIFSRTIRPIKLRVLTKIPQG